jgi:AraC-like DNA-binding protein
VRETSFSAYLREVRLRNAAELIARQPLTVRQVALLVGYRQPTHFVKAFRRRFGVTPAHLSRSRRAGARRVKHHHQVKEDTTRHTLCEAVRRGRARDGDSHRPCGECSRDRQAPRVDPGQTSGERTCRTVWDQLSARSMEGRLRP